ncbi:zinc ribbon domain-containing protein [Pseudomonas entomophila]|uniref:zinc ribbon domain-containing protein n=1 Tax=Pseudomonas entomophila TaxID=312306 RepID=UPI0023D8C712|nr:zinc ribbon domain-containing protein [Pseudomonas entomophila]MDF0732336.1 zinc ribbon domain-containing protein [Pseudomonas entomophila]
MDGVVGVVSLAVFIGVWLWLARRQKAKGRGWIARQLIGSSAACIAGLLVIALAIEIGLIHPTEKTASKPAVTYTINKDDYSPGRPRKVEVTIPHRLGDVELAEVAKKIRDDSNVDADRTFIGLRVLGQSDRAYWANVSFDPDYKATLIGLSATDYAKLMALDLNAYPDQKGSWLRDGALGHVMVLYTKGDKYFIDSLFATGGKNTDEYVGKRMQNGALRLEQPDNGFGEYYIVEPGGNLQGWGENGVYMTLPARPAIAGTGATPVKG